MKTRRQRAKMMPMTVPAIALGLREWWDVCGGVGGGLKIVAIVGVEKPDIGWVIVALPLPLLVDLLVCLFLFWFAGSRGTHVPPITFTTGCGT